MKIYKRKVLDIDEFKVELPTKIIEQTIPNKFHRSIVTHLQNYLFCMGAVVELSP
jgi:hypothetical protein